MAGMLAQQELDTARSWATGKTGAEIAAAAQSQGYTADQVAQVMGTTANAVKSTGYGSAAGVNSAVAGQTWGGYTAPSAPAPAPASAPAPAPASTAPSGYTPPAPAPSPTGYGTSAFQLGVDKLKAGWQQAAGTADPFKTAYDFGKTQGWNSSEMAAALNSISGTNEYTADRVNEYTQKNLGGTLGTGNALNDVASGISAAGLKAWGTGNTGAFNDVYKQVGQDGLGAGHAAEALSRATGISYEEALKQVEGYGTQGSLGMLRADTDWATEKGINDIRLINRDMHLNGMYAEDAAAQYGASSGKALNAIFTAQGLSPLPERSPGYVAPDATQYAPSLNRAINPETETIEGRLNGLLGTDERGNFTNPVVRQAVDRAMQQMAGRGLLNSSMASQAAQEAAIAKAIEIVGPDAERYFQQGRANQDAQNVFSRDEQNYKYDLSKIGVGQGNDLEKIAFQGQQDLGKLAYQNQLDLTKLSAQQRNELEKLAINNQYAVDAKAKDYVFTASEADKDRNAQLTSANISASRPQDDNSWRFELARLEQQANQGSAQATVVSNAYGRLMDQTLSISGDANMDESAKGEPAQSAGEHLQPDRRVQRVHASRP